MGALDEIISSKGEYILEFTYLQQPGFLLTHLTVLAGEISDASDLSAGTAL